MLIHCFQDLDPHHPPILWWGCWWMIIREAYDGTNCFVPQQLGLSDYDRRLKQSHLHFTTNTTQSMNKGRWMQLSFWSGMGIHWPHCITDHTESIQGMFTDSVEWGRDVSLVKGWPLSTKMPSMRGQIVVVVLVYMVLLWHIYKRKKPYSTFLILSSTFLGLNQIRVMTHILTIITLMLIIHFKGDSAISQFHKTRVYTWLKSQN